MTPQLALRGRLIVAVGCLFVGAGSIHAATWPLIALGTCILAALGTAYLLFYPTAIFLRRHKVELAWWVPPGDLPGGALTVGVPFLLHVVVRNRGSRRLRIRDAHVFAARPLEALREVALDVPAGFEGEVKVEMRARAAGRWVLHGALVPVVDAFGLFEVRAYFPSPVRLEVFPPLGLRPDAAALRPRRGAEERAGVRIVRRRGLSGDLREIREHVPGDPFKFIAWKATARRRRLMVRELENEMVLTWHIVLDMGGSMRSGAPGQTQLDWALATAALIARAALEGGDRVGLVTFDTRVFATLGPGDGRSHFLQLVDKLVDTQNVVDADLTDLTDGELVAAVARYVRHQEGVDVRVARAPRAGDPAWTRLAAGPGGELYDSSALLDVVGSLLPGRRPLGDIPLQDPAQLARLRLFCQVRGIELPYRTTPEPGARAAGLAAALGHVTREGRGHHVVLLSDLDGIVDDPATARRALGLLRQKRHQLVVLCPYGPAFWPRARTLPGRRVGDALGLEEARRSAFARGELARLGARVALAGPTDTPATLARKLAGPRRAV